ncbi:CBASS cGAMP-activated phospholipase [Priestia megaterium]|uniref:CBASS cGAMP-activated phospholipase n=1 Tax=Priestia megaterium TaxID=1404 RepID=UPI003175D077
MNKNNDFKILSIDGGGIKGLYSAVILAAFEEKYGSIKDYFHLICGTSTGGIIALALAAGIPAKKIVDLYTNKGPLIFPYKRKSIRKIHWLKQTIIKSKYSDEILRQSLEEVFKEKKISDCQTMILIPTVNITTGTPCVIKPDHYNPNYNRDNSHSLVEVALSTAAAPTYFPVQKISTMPDPNYQFVDGGLWANNPSLLGIQEAYRHFINREGYNYSNFSLLSISTLHQYFSYKKSLKQKSRSFFHWNSKLISLIIDLQSISTHHHIQFLNESLHGHYIRIESEQLDENEKKIIDLDLATKKSIDLLVAKGEEASARWINKEELFYFFKKKKEIFTNESVGTV